MLSIVIATAIICCTIIGMQLIHYEFKREMQDWKDNIELGKALEAKIAEMETLKKQVDHLLLKNGLGGSVR